ncbi:MAG: glycosyltransferase family 2 protein [Hydrogenophaga sp.]|jgi:glycosyltransferase involved in cell wall biosynthesis|nr:glycosyltransferase family 2 protein [Hydrogenophaga sp.]
MGMDVVIVTYNGLGCVEDCLRSLQNEAGLRIRVLDNASTDDTASWVRAHCPEALLTELPHNMGFGRANNVGIAEALAAGAPYVLLLNQDTVVPPGSLQQLQAFMDAHPEIGACSPLQVERDGLAPDPNTLLSYLCPHARPYLSDLVAGTVKPFYEVHGLNAAVWLVRATTFLRAGGFDPLFFMYGEDDDLLARWRHLGVRFALVPGVRVAHVRYRPPPSQPPLGAVEREARWAYSRLLLAAKVPGHSSAYVGRVLMVRGLLMPLLETMLDMRLPRLAGHWRAALSCLAQWRSIARHARVTAQAGAHFLSVGATARSTPTNAPGSGATATLTD